MMVYDKYISSMLPIEGSRANDNLINEYIDIGIINSDYIHRIRENKELVKKYKSDLGIPIDKIIISVFDSNTDNCDLIPISDVLFFMKTILKLLDSNEELFFIFKPLVLNIFNRDIELLRTFEQLKNHNRCFFAISPNFPYAACELIGISDLVITVFASSILTEALSGGIKTVCLAPRNNSYSEFWDTIGKIPNLCFNSYEQLQEIVEYWLMDITGENFKTWQDEYVKSYIDQYCDGQALLRLKHILN
jgi:predicted nucleotidyltransferase